MKKTALVISGGGSKGAFAVGAIWSLYERFRKNGWFSIVGGCSTGALIAPMASLLGAEEPMASNARKTMVYFYSHLKTHDVLVRKNIIGLIQEQNSINRYTPLKKIIQRIFTPETYTWLQSEQAPFCYVVYVNYKSGRNVCVSPKDEGMTRDRFIDAMLASLSVPVFIEPTIIDGEACLDGGVRDMVPFEPAISRGAECVVPVFLHPYSIEASDDPFKRVDKILQRTLMIMMDETLYNDYEMTKLINLGTQLRLEILSAVANKRSVKRKIEQILKKPEYAQLMGNDKQLVSIVDGIRPDYTLTDEPLKLDPVFMRKWLKLGYEKAGEIVTTSPFD
jgi:NTE family protein